MRNWHLSVFAVALISPALFADDLSALSDEFDDPATLKNWQHVDKVEKANADQIKRLEINKKNGRLTIEPFTSVWYKDYRGVLLFKPVTGDFVVTTSLAVHGKTGPDAAPRSQFSLAGIMVRAPRDVTPQTWAPGGENYVFLSMGAADRPGSFQFEVKTTINSNSQLQISEGAKEGQIRVARVGSALIMLRKLEGEQWRVHRRYPRADFPETLQVGLTCYTDWQTCSRMDPPTHNKTVIKGGNPDLIAEVDYIRYGRPNVPDALKGKNLVDPNQASDEQLLSFLGGDDVKATPSTPPPAAAARDDGPPGGIRLLSGYQHRPSPGIDSRVGRIWKEGGLTIDYETGMTAGNAAEQAKLEERLWTKTQDISGLQLRVTRTKDGKIHAGYEFEGATASFSAKVANEQDVSEFLLMVLSYPIAPDKK